MKIVSYEEFCRMPAGTIFAPYVPHILQEELAIKVDPGQEDPNPVLQCFKHYFNGVMPLSPWFGDGCCLYSVGDSEPVSFEVYDGDNNDYIEYPMFLIFEEADVDKMIKVLQWAKNGCVGEYDK